jgi:hypothetical protein
MAGGLYFFATWILMSCYGFEVEIREKFGFFFEASIFEFVDNDFSCSCRG